MRFLVTNSSLSASIEPFFKTVQEAKAEAEALASGHPGSESTVFAEICSCKSESLITWDKPAEMQDCDEGGEDAK